MTLLKRTSTVRCDDPGCNTEITVEHDLDMEYDTGYASTEALSRAGWAGMNTVALKGSNAIGNWSDLCPICLAKKRVLRFAEQQRAGARIEKKRRKGRKA